MKNAFKDIAGYLLGLCIFVLGIPALMWLVSGRPWPYVPASAFRFGLAVGLALIGLALSIWSIVYMKKVGKGNPFDAYGHEVAPRTKELMTEGPYRICRNPMLLGIYLYDIGWLIYLWAWWPLAIFLVQTVLLTLQVRNEEKRLEKDFGEAYLNYKKRTGRYLLMILAVAALLPGCTHSKKTAVAEPSSTISETGYEVERFITDSGLPVDITLIKHGTLAVNYGDLWIQIDPVTKLGKTTDYAADFPKADFILITHEHGDHLDAEAIEALTKEDTKILLNPSSRDKLDRGEAITNGEKRQLTDAVLLEAVPAYNNTPGRENFHPKGNGNGYVLTIDGLRIYIAGDTEDIPELAEIKDIDVAFLPVNQPYTMTVEQCVRAARMIQPKVLIPYHFGQTDLSELPGLLPGIDVRLRQMQ